MSVHSTPSRDVSTLGKRAGTDEEVTTPTKRARNTAAMPEAVDLYPHLLDAMEDDLDDKYGVNEPSDPDVADEAHRRRMGSVLEAHRRGMAALLAHQRDQWTAYTEGVLQQARDMMELNGPDVREEAQKVAEDAVRVMENMHQTLDPARHRLDEPAASIAAAREKARAAHHLWENCRTVG